MGYPYLFLNMQKIKFFYKYWLKDTKWEQIRSCAMKLSGFTERFVLIVIINFN